MSHARRLSTILAMSIMSLLAWSNVGQAQQTQEQVKAAPPISLVLDGLEIQFDNYGNWSRMFSTYRQPVSFPDRVGLRKAYTIAEEKGKAQIIRFMQENVTSERLIEEVNREVQTATRTQDGATEAISRTTQRDMVESVKEFTRSYSEGMLRGVTVIEQGYDEKTEEAWVKIGLTRESAKLGAQLQSDLRAPTKTGKAAGKTDSSKKPITQPSEVRTRLPVDTTGMDAPLSPAHMRQ